MLFGGRKGIRQVAFNSPTSHAGRRIRNRNAIRIAAHCVIERLESRQLLSVAAPVTGLNDTVWHPDANNPKLNDAVFGGDNAALTRVAAYAATHSTTAAYTFLNTNDAFLYAASPPNAGNGTATQTPIFLNDGQPLNVDANGNPVASGDANGAALTDQADVADTIFDAEGYFTTNATPGDSYTVNINGPVDDIVGVYIGGNGTPGSGTLVTANGWQGATSPIGASGVANVVDLPANSSIPVEVIYGNGFGGASLGGVTITDSTATQVPYSTGVQTGFPEPAADAPTLTANAGNGQVQLNWNSTNYATTYSVYRTDPAHTTAAAIATGLTGLSYIDTTTANNTAYTYYITADNVSNTPGTHSNTVTATPVAGPTAPATNVVPTRTGANTVTVTFTAPLFGSNYSISRSTTGAAGSYTTITPAGGITTTSFTDPNAPVNGADGKTPTNYYYIVNSTNTAGTTPSAAAFLGTGDGFQASYYASDTAKTGVYGGDQTGGVLLTQPDGTPIATQPTPDGVSPPTNSAVLGFQRNEATPINDVGFTNANPPPNSPQGFNIIEGSGNLGLDFSARWVGYIEPQNTGYVTFLPRSDDGVAVTVYDPNHLDANNQPTPVTLQPDNLFVSRGPTTDADAVIGTDGAPYLMQAGTKYLVQVDYQNGVGGWEADLSWAVSSTTASQTANTYDVQSPSLVTVSEVFAPAPTFQTVDAANPTGLAKDATYYSLTATGGPGAVQFTFANIGADSYRIFRSTTQTGTYSQIGTIPATQGAAVNYTDFAGLTDGATYYYIVTGVDASGETPQSAGLHGSGTPTSGALTAPSSIGASRIGGSTQVLISFSPTQFASTYDVQRGTSLNADGTIGGTITDVTPGGTSATTVKDPNAAVDGTFYYAVTASNPTASSPASTTAMVGPIPAGQGLYDSVFQSLSL